MNQSQKYLSIALATLTALSFSVDAKVKLPGMISSGMIVQREQPVKLWGTADPGEPINVKVTNSKIVEEIPAFIENKTHLFHQRIKIVLVDKILRNEAGKVINQ